MSGGKLQWDGGGVPGWKVGESESADLPAGQGLAGKLPGACTCTPGSVDVGCPVHFPQADPIADAARELGVPSEEFTRLNDAWLAANERLERTALAAATLTNLAWFAVGVLVGACVIVALAVLVGGQ